MVFDRVMPEPNQIEKKLVDLRVTAEDLLRVPEGAVTEAGLRQNVAVGLGYVEAWLRGIGCVPLFHLMEDAATAEISRAQLWQWVHHGAALEDGRPVTIEMCDGYIDEELALIRAPRFAEFLTVPAYARVVAAEGVGEANGLR